MPETGYLDIRNGGYHMAGTRVGLDIPIQDFRNGRSAEAILKAFPSIGSLGKVYGAIAFILENPEEAEAYLREQNRRYEEFQAANPLPARMSENFGQGRRDTPAGRT